MIAPALCSRDQSQAISSTRRSRRLLKVRLQVRFLPGPPRYTVDRTVFEICLGGL